MRNRRRNRRPSIYRFLLRLVPLEFRMEYGPEMVRTHRERVALRTRRGRPAPLLFFLFEYFL